MATASIVPPAEGGVTLNLSWDEAQVLTRALGMVNSKDLDACAPTLTEFVLSMVDHIGRNVPGESGKYYTYTSGNQVYIDIKKD